MSEDHEHDPTLVERKGIKRRRFLRDALAFGGGAAAGVAGAVAYERWVSEPDAVISSDGFTLTNPELQATIELANATNNGRGVQRLIWSVPTTEKVMTITFDDGPTEEYTPTVLDALAAAGVKATFNIMGYNAEQHTAVLKEVVAAGHEIGNHTLTHKDLAFETERGVREQLSAAKEIVDELSGTVTKLFRPPRSVMTGATADISAQLGYDILLYTSIVAKPPGTSAQVLKDYAATLFGNGNIMAMHDGIGRGTFEPNARFARDLAQKRKDELAALPSILEEAQQQGYRIVTVSELLAAGDVPGPGAHVPG